MSVKMGRPSDYSKELVDEICDLVANGSNLNKITSQADMPNRSTLYLWLDTHEYFSVKYTRAREDRADWRFDRMDDIGQNLIDGSIDAAQARVLMDMIKWQAGKEKPKAYGDSTQIKHADADGNKLTFGALLDEIDGTTSGLQQAEEEPS